MWVEDHDLAWVPEPKKTMKKKTRRRRRRAGLLTLLVVTTKNRTVMVVFRFDSLLADAGVAAAVFRPLFLSNIEYNRWRFVKLTFCASFLDRHTRV